MDRLPNIKVGDRITAKLANDITNAIRRQQIIPGPSYRTKTTTQGTVIVFKDEKGGGVPGGGAVSDVIPCIVNGGTALDGYSVTLYLKGFDHSSRSDIKSGTLFVPEIATHTDLPAGTSILAHICEATFMQSDEQEDEEDQNQEGGQS